MSKRHSRASDTSSAYSGSDKMLASSIGPDDDCDDEDEETTNLYNMEATSLKESIPDSLQESLPDSDDEDGYDEQSNVSNVEQGVTGRCEKVFNVWIV